MKVFAAAVLFLALVAYTKAVAVRWLPCFVLIIQFDVHAAIALMLFVLLF